MANLKIEIGVVRDVETEYSDYIKDKEHQLDQPFGGLRVRVELTSDKDKNKTTIEPKDLPWAFPLLPKAFQVIPKIGEGAMVLCDDNPKSQRYYIGPVISQPQYNTECKKRNGVSLLNTSIASDNKPLEDVSGKIVGSFPNVEDVAVVGRGAEDVILKFNDSTKESEVDIRAGIRKEPTNDPNPSMTGNIIFNEVDPAYIQLKYKSGLCSNPDANSIINIVADKINLISNKDDNVAHNIHNKNGLIPNDKISDVTLNLQAVPLGNNLYDLLMIMKECILNHVHPWPGKPQCGDWGGYINRLVEYDLSKILSKHVRTS